jgi:hypothetical protein
MATNPIAVLSAAGKMPVTKSEFIERISNWGTPLQCARARTAAKWTAVAMWPLLLVCADIGEAAARGRYSNFGPWSSNHSQASEISTTPRPNEHRPHRGFALGSSKKDLRQREASYERHRHAASAPLDRHLTCRHLDTSNRPWMSPNGQSFRIHSRNGGVPMKQLSVVKRHCVAFI